MPPCWQVLVDHDVIPKIGVATLGKGMEEVSCSNDAGVVATLPFNVGDETRRATSDQCWMASTRFSRVFQRSVSALGPCRVKVHQLIAIRGNPRPMGQAGAVGVAGFGEVGPVLIHLARHAQILGGDAFAEIPPDGFADGIEDVGNLGECGAPGKCWRRLAAT